MLIREIFEGKQKREQGQKVFKKRPFSTEKYIVTEPEDVFKNLTPEEIEQVMDYNWRRKHFMKSDGTVPNPEDLVKKNYPTA